MTGRTLVIVHLNYDSSRSTALWVTASGEVTRRAWKQALKRCRAVAGDFLRIENNQEMAEILVRDERGEIVAIIA